MPRLRTYREGVTTTEAAPLSIDSPTLTTPAPSPAPSPATATGLLARARIHGLTGPSAVAVAALITAGGVAVDVLGDPSVGTGTAVAVVLAVLVATAASPLRSLATAAVLPPLLVAAAALALAVVGGQNEGSRELVLDVGTTLALSAPLVFGATAAGLIVVVVRVGLHAAQRRR